MDKPTRYKVHAKLEIVREEFTPTGPNSGDGYWNPVYSGEKLTVEETVILGTMGFEGLMQVLQGMHHAVASLRPKGDK